MRGDRPRAALIAAWTAAVLGLGHAAVSVYWAAGGTLLLDTLSEGLEQAGQEREPLVVAGLWATAIVKGGVAVSALVLVGVASRHLPGWTHSRIPRLLGWLAAVILTVYGGVNTLLGLLVLNDIITVSRDGDFDVLGWYTYLWNPWFMLWGLAFVLSLWLSRGIRLRA